jgi:hypothetical protein
MSGLMPKRRPHPYQHQRPHRPRDLARRMQPPPARGAPPDLRYLFYAGIVLAAVLAALAMPYLVVYLLQVINGA